MAHNNSALKILKERYANGEISDEEFETKKNILEKDIVYSNKTSNNKIGIFLIIGLLVIFLGGSLLFPMFSFHRNSKMMNNEFEFRTNNENSKIIKFNGKDSPSKGDMPNITKGEKFSDKNFGSESNKPNGEKSMMDKNKCKQYFKSSEDDKEE